MGAEAEKTTAAKCGFPATVVLDLGDAYLGPQVPFPALTLVLVLIGIASL
jgi:hypothetical protein